MPCTIDALLEDCSDSDIGGICHDVGWGVRFRMHEEGSLCQSLLDSESPTSIRVQHKLLWRAVTVCEEVVEGLKGVSTVRDETPVKVYEAKKFPQLAL